LEEQLGEQQGWLNKRSRAEPKKEQAGKPFASEPPRFIIFIFLHGSLWGNGRDSAEAPMGLFLV
jgi:hypothetical protein